MRHLRTGPQDTRPRHSEYPKYLTNCHDPVTDTEYAGKAVHPYWLAASSS